VCKLGRKLEETKIPKAFISKLSDVEPEAAESQVWIELSERCGYLNKNKAADLMDQTEHVIAQIVKMINNPDEWIISAKE